MVDRMIYRESILAKGDTIQSYQMFPRNESTIPRKLNTRWLSSNTKANKVGEVDDVGEVQKLHTLRLPSIYYINLKVLANSLNSPHFD